MCYHLVDDRPTPSLEGAPRLFREGVGEARWCLLRHHRTGRERPNEPHGDDAGEAGEAIGG